MTHLTLFKKAGRDERQIIVGSTNIINRLLRHQIRNNYDEIENWLMNKMVQSRFRNTSYKLFWLRF
jgi:hypothetical protein